MAAAARAYAATVTLEAFEQRVHELLERQWEVELPMPTSGSVPG